MAPKRMKLVHPAPEGLSPARIALIESINKDCKMLQLPVEILMEIFSWFSDEIPPETSGYHNKASREGRQTDQERALRRLYQTCAIWRHLLLARRWKEVKHQQMFRMLKASEHMKPAVFAEGLYFATHVRTLRIELVKDHAMNALLVAALKAMSNLHTFHLLSPEYYFGYNDFPYTTPFNGQTFPQVRSLVLPLYALDILKCFPKITKITAACWSEDIRPYNVLGKHCKDVEEFEGFTATGITVRRLVRLLPNLRSLKLDLFYFRPVFLDLLRSLSALNQLNHIGIRTHLQDFEKVKADPDLLSVIKVAKEILKGNKATGPKTIGFFHERWDHTEARDVRWDETIIVGEERQ
ncbi:hypothetical protein NLJ89_g11292 [Agrocybe chaxingu]|uniref:Uncharacterized protein n=1 Tax=Agrocybe chaxingu TaxID=84603 RepID=A0A9W8MN55_9AGAR|nr:hypothetical protein NLJ89_g11292 [Agrocybe chaxingu]